MRRHIGRSFSSMVLVCWTRGAGLADSRGTRLEFSRSSPDLTPYIPMHVILGSFQLKVYLNVILLTYVGQCCYFSVVVSFCMSYTTCTVSVTKIMKTMQELVKICQELVFLLSSIKKYLFRQILTNLCPKKKANGKASVPEVETTGS